MNGTELEDLYHDLNTMSLSNNCDPRQHGNLTGGNYVADHYLHVDELANGLMDWICHTQKTTNKQEMISKMNWVKWATEKTMWSWISSRIAETYYDLQTNKKQTKHRNYLKIVIPK